MSARSSQLFCLKMRVRQVSQESGLRDWPGLGFRCSDIHSKPPSREVVPFIPGWYIFMYMEFERNFVHFKVLPI